MKKLKLSLLMLVAVISATAFAVNSEAVHADTVKAIQSNTNQVILMRMVNGCGSKMVNVIQVSVITWERTTGSLMASVKIQVGAMLGG